MGIFFCAIAMAWPMGWAMAKSLGGLTGDTYGATNEIIEMAVILAQTALIPYGWLEPLPDFLDRF